MRNAIAVLTGCLFILTLYPHAGADSRLGGGLENLEERVTALEHVSETLQGELSELEKRVSVFGQISVPVVVDANGQVIGAIVGGVGPQVPVLMDLGGIPTNLLVTPTEIKGACCTPLPGVFLKVLIVVERLFSPSWLSMGAQSLLPHSVGPQCPANTTSIFPNPPQAGTS